MTGKDYYSKVAIAIGIFLMLVTIVVMIISALNPVDRAAANVIDAAAFMLICDGVMKWLLIFAALFAALKKRV